MIDLNVEIPKRAFNDVYAPYIGCMARVQIFFGGSSSGKSVFVAQRAVIDIINGGRNYLCVRNVGRTLKGSSFNEIRKVVSEWGLDHLFKVNKSELTITCNNGYQIVFKGLDDVAKIKSITPEKGVFTDIWVEEGTECSKQDIKQLAKRLRGKAKVKKRITFSFNPIFKSHWLFKEYFSGKLADDETTYNSPSLSILKTTYLDNRFLELDDVEELEDEQDEYFYNVYTLGNWGTLGDVIFTNVTIRDITNDPISKTFDIFKNGLDFGFSNDPTALTRSYYHRATKTIYIIKDWRAKGITNDEIARQIKPIIRSELIVCDSAEPKSIQELRNCDINADGAVKGKDSIMHGIQWLKQQRIIIDKRCQDTINNFQLYHWKKDREGNPINVPVDRFNDFIDSLRYAFEDEMDAIDWADDYDGEDSIAAKGEEF